jgi:hypothetical protein
MLKGTLGCELVALEIKHRLQFFVAEYNQSCVAEDLTFLFPSLKNKTLCRPFYLIYNLKISVLKPINFARCQRYLG